MLFHYTRVDVEKLSLLSDKELRLLAEKMGIYVPEGLDRHFLIEEIIEAFEDDTAEKSFSHDAPDHVEEKSSPAQALFPADSKRSPFPIDTTRPTSSPLCATPCGFFHSGISLRVQERK